MRNIPFALAFVSLVCPVAYSQNPCDVVTLPALPPIPSEPSKPAVAVTLRAEKDSGSLIARREYWKMEEERIKRGQEGFLRRLFLNGLKLKLAGDYGTSFVGFLGPGPVTTADKNPSLKGNVTLTWDIQLSTLLRPNSEVNLYKAQSEAARIDRERDRLNKMRQERIKFDQAEDHYERLSKQCRGDKDKDGDVGKAIVENFHGARKAAVAFLELAGYPADSISEWMSLPGPFRLSTARENGDSPSKGPVSQPTVAQR